ncbi:Dynamin-2A [Acorus calamus]|uniref:Dynamin-2A n=1 Tax=Acorus calamus TaxID=4465 RepID=A0AAV9F8X1_ACOCL|nr:Dynamin-2A [Acorus calamus]
MERWWATSTWEGVFDKGSSWKVVASFEGNFPNRIKQLPLDRHFDINNVKRIVLEADGYQPYLISPEKALRSLIKIALELAKEPSRLCVDEVIAIASAALDGFRNEAKKMVVALVDMERAFVPPQHFIRLVQRRMNRQRREEELKNRSSKKGHEAERAVLNRVTSPQIGGQQTGGGLKSMKEKFNQGEKDVKDGSSSLQTAGASGEMTAESKRLSSKCSPNLRDCRPLQPVDLCENLVKRENPQKAIDLQQHEGNPYQALEWGNGKALGGILFELPVKGLHG